jgi:cyclomaltodextrinase / maltogenic alpha-amylase / neopullulanase
MASDSPISNWSHHLVGYQCFVDSHAIGDVSLAEKSNRYASDVYNQPPRLLEWSEEFPEYSYGYAFYGGDLDGVINSVNQYLSDFGVNMLYLTPIFKGESNHKYDTLNYKTIDPQFGDLETFKKLINACHHHNVKLILDGVFNHTSYHHEWYLKALQGESPYQDYYQKDKDGHFLNWNGVETLALLNHQHPDVQEYFYSSPENIVKYWLDQGADGWRLDVAERLGKEVIKKIKRSIQANFDDKILYGEVIETYGKEWLGDDLLDGAMNYVFLGNTVNFLKDKINGETFLNELAKMYNQYPKEQLYNSWNIISTHDTNRMIYEVDGNENLFKMAVTLQFTYPGIPMIYNGDELGILPGQLDKDNRQGLDWQRVDILKLKAQNSSQVMQSMDWNRVNQYSSFHFFYKHLIWLRKNYSVLIEGDFVPAYHDDNIIAYFRCLDDRYALIIVNKGSTKEISIEIPQHIQKNKPVLQGVHGPIGKVDLSAKTLNIIVYSQNSLIFVN